jgi:diguanylate cyclase (GGDEF)-like protein
MHGVMRVVMRTIAEGIQNRLGRRSRPLAAVLTIVLLPAVWLLCRLALPADLGLLLFALPVLLAASYVNMWMGILTALAAGTVWSLPALFTGRMLDGPFAVVVNYVAGTGLLVLVACLESARRRAVERQQMLSRTDSLTGAENSRSFLERTEEEIQRIGRHERPLSMVYVDVDDFKRANDVYGHSVGDGLLCAVAGVLLAGTRATDVVARMGGDEFALLLPETGQAEAQRVLDRIRKDLDFIVRKGGWPIGFSMGCVTCAVPPDSAEGLLHQADQTMYAAKKQGKNRTVFAVHPESP